MTAINEAVVRAMVWAQSRKGEEGQGLAEYGLILALVAVVAAAVLGPLGTAAKGAIESATNAF